MSAELTGKRVLVTGGAGFLGGHFIERLLNEGAVVRAAIHKREPVRHFPSVEYMQCDLRHMEDCMRATDGVDYIFHCAANTQGAGVIATTPMVHVTPNVVMNTHLLEAAYIANVKKFLFISSGAAYPDTGARPAEEHEMLDAHPSPVYHAVAWMKRYAEILCETYASHLKRPMPCVVVRPSNVYGPWDKYDPDASHVTAATLRKVYEGHNPIKVWGTGEDIRDVIYIDDFIEGSMKAFAHSDDFLAVNICSGDGVSVKQILNTALKVNGDSDRDIQFDEDKPKTVNIRLICGKKAKSIFDFEAKTGLEEGIDKTLQWMHENTGAWK